MKRSQSNESVYKYTSILLVTLNFLTANVVNINDQLTVNSADDVDNVPLISTFNFKFVKTDDLF